jgi:hypothetical protein
MVARLHSRGSQNNIIRPNSNTRYLSASISKSFDSPILATLVSSTEVAAAFIAFLMGEKLTRFLPHRAAVSMNDIRFGTVPTARNLAFNGTPVLWEAVVELKIRPLVNR